MPGVVRVGIKQCNMRVQCLSIVCLAFVAVSLNLYILWLLEGYSGDVLYSALGSVKDTRCNLLHETDCPLWKVESLGHYPDPQAVDAKVDLAESDIPVFPPKLLPGQPNYSNSSRSPTPLDESVVGLLERIQNMEMEGKLRDQWLRVLHMPSEGYHSFNATASDSVGNFRNVPDTRTESCKTLSYHGASLPKASIIVIFHNEARSTLLRTIHSILRRTEDILLHEVILIDDASTFEWLKQPLEDYVNHLPKVKLIRLGQREGLIRARLAGAQKATGEILVFLDAHSEVNVQWLEPLLARIAENHRVVAVPQMDIIQWEHFEYWRAIGLYYGTFTWNMEFKYRVYPAKKLSSQFNDTEPVASPVMVGCAHAVDRSYFFEQGAYDEGMDIWGGENIEHSFRTWMCGGRVEIVPCSRVGHVFKPRLPYSFNGDHKKIVQQNLIRTAEVWMGSYKQHFYATQSSVAPIDLVSLEDRRDLRYNLDCHNFSWYLKTVIPEMPIPSKVTKHFGQIIWEADPSKCLHVTNGKITLATCETQELEDQHFFITKQGHFHYKDCCIIPPVKASQPSTILQLSRCQKCVSSSPLWTYNEHKQINAASQNSCLSMDMANSTAVMTACVSSKLQKWSFSYTFNFSHQVDINMVTLEAQKMPDSARYFGRLKNIGLDLCVNVHSDGAFSMISCSQQRRYQQIIHLDRDGKLKFKNFCLCSTGSDHMTFVTCIGTDKNCFWLYEETRKQMKSLLGNKCVTHSQATANQTRTPLVLEDCSFMNRYQQWRFSRKQFLEPLLG